MGMKWLDKTKKLSQAGLMVWKTGALPGTLQDEQLHWLGNPEKWNLSWEWRAAFSPDGRRLALLMGPDISLFDWPTGQLKPRTTIRPHPVPYWITFSPDGTELLTCGFDKTVKFPDNYQVRLWAIDEDQFKQKMFFDTKRIEVLDFALGGEAVLTTEDFACILRDKMTGKLRWRWDASGNYPALALAPDRRHVALGNANGTIYILRLKEPRGR
jgi:WD40 repeat protein